MRGDGEVLADEITRQVHRGLSADLPVQRVMDRLLHRRRKITPTPHGNRGRRRGIHPFAHDGNGVAWRVKVGNVVWFVI